MAFFQKQRYLIDFTLSSLLRRKGKNLGLLLVYVAIVFMLASVMLFTHSLRKEAGIVLQNSPQIILQRVVAGRHALIPASYLEKIGRMRGVIKKQGRLWGYLYDPAVKANYTMMVDTKKKLEPLEIIIGSAISRTRGVGIGDYITFRSYDSKPLSFKVKDVLDNKSELISADLVLMSDASYRQLFDVPEGFYTDLVLAVRNDREVHKIAEKLAVKLPDTRPILREEILRTYDSIFSWRQGIVFVLLIGAVLAFVIFSWDKASGLSAEEKREIGILKAIGWETEDVLRMKFWEGMIISLTAFLLGYLLAYIHVFYASASLFEPVLKGWSVLYPKFSPIPYVDPLQVATLFFFTVFPYIVATIIPIWRVSITDPDAVMR